MKDYTITNNIYFRRILEAINREDALKEIASELSNRNDVKEVKVSQDSIIEEDEVIERLIVKLSFTSIQDTLTVTVKNDLKPVVM